MVRKIAILGSADSTRDLAPFDDPEWEIWGLAWRFFDHPRMDVGFEVHNPTVWPSYVKPELYGAWMNKPEDKEGKPITVYALPHVAALFDGVTPYPVDEIEKLIGRRYFTSSIAYMLALAIAQEPDEIGLWGVDLVHGEEYAHQRPAAEYLLGIAHAQGIKLTIPEQSALLKSSYVYGLEDDADADPMRARFETKAKDYREKIADLKAQIFTLEGAAHECEEVVAACDARARGLWGK